MGNYSCVGRTVHFKPALSKGHLYTPVLISIIAKGYSVWDVNFQLLLSYLAHRHNSFRKPDAVLQ